VNQCLFTSKLEFHFESLKKGKFACASWIQSGIHERLVPNDKLPMKKKESIKQAINQSIEQMTGTMIGTHGDLFVREKEFGNINRVESETMTTLFLFRRRKAMTAFVRR